MTEWDLLDVAICGADTIIVDVVNKERAEADNSCRCKYLLIITVAIPTWNRVLEKLMLLNLVTVFLGICLNAKVRDRRSAQIPHAR
jgi:hypothetical protein